MSWRDFFYFSRGERRALILVLGLIIVSGLILIFTNRDAVNQKPEQASQTEKNTAALKGTSESEKKEPSEKKKSNTPERKASSEASERKKTSKKRRASEKTTAKKESVSERVERLTSYAHPSYRRTPKFKKGTVVELNTADTTTLKKVPGIGSTFANRIVKFRNLLGGYYSVSQLSEVYGIDEERYMNLKEWFTADPSSIQKIEVNEVAQKTLYRHPYITYGQAKVIYQLRRQKGRLEGWVNLRLLEEFTDKDKERLKHYLSFE